MKGWTLAELIDDAQYETLLRNAKEALKPFAQADGSVAFRSPALIVSAERR